MPKILFIGDVVAEPGRRTLSTLLPKLREEHEPDFVVVNGENAAGGMGITPKTADEIFELGVDVITLGNHTYRHREVYSYLDSGKPIIRCANQHSSNPGKGSVVVEQKQGSLRLGVINLIGQFGLDNDGNPFDVADRLVREMRGDADLILVDFHAELTSEKVTMGWFLDGRVTAVVGTHTHVPTADARVLPEGTAYCTDVGMTGSRAGVIGVVKEAIITKLRTGMPQRFDSASGDEHLMGVLVESGRDGTATKITQLIVPLAPTVE
ncbi:MAG: TIGR00282 family metallophosphoesterase [Solirubrobacterales bacterium]|nr:TIGR00282 family metallophosphoesterase [Solirubrobacterales bacterium]